MHTSSKSRHGTVRALSGVLLALALALTGCSGGGSDDTDSGGGKAAGVAPDEAGRSDGKQAGGGRGADSRAGKKQPVKPTDTHVIRTAELTVRVKDVPAALERARTAAEDAGGIVGNESTSRDDAGRERSRVVLRVPQDEYEDVLTALEGTGKLIDRDAKAQDVTDQVVDVESRVASQRASVARVRELMDKATKLSDVVSLEGELSTRQADLESLLAQQASLKDRTSMATITLSLTEHAVASDAGDDDPTFMDALSGGWDVFVTALRWVGVALAAVLPFAVVFALLVLVWLRRRPQGGQGDDGAP
ncbi:DUF4349 domain-containing protein [Streptomyces kanamyceticus]|uniref:DUF4349 domain-containing protein n=1 Tax=Streptomyces kanamyceticus TaxID=1967 RepID=A0A5J6G984_STRKN|nr:DUF4349 domain-containing protein [Streptomyces kanamyceticus]QEU91174.1 DUF4349 domain-containing protein [Streptomyces kanamyceticus]